MAGLTVLDASVLLALQFKADPHHFAATSIIESHGALAISTITLAEVLVRAARDDAIDQHLVRLARLDIAEIPIEQGSAPALARLRATTGLKLPDCCVLQTAITAGADAIATRDAQLRAVAAQYGFATP